MTCPRKLDPRFQPFSRSREKTNFAVMQPGDAVGDCQSQSAAGTRYIAAARGIEAGKRLQHSGTLRFRNFRPAIEKWWGMPAQAVLGKKFATLELPKA
jgi:hypothetical protein